MTSFVSVPHPSDIVTYFLVLTCTVLVGKFGGNNDWQIRMDKDFGKKVWRK